MATDASAPGGVDTPYASVDLERVDRNIQRMQNYCDAHRLALRPHVKTHKLPAIAHRQIHAGAVGVTCQKITEAEAMVAAGIENVLVAYPLLGAAKLERLCGLARQSKISTAADSSNVARQMSAAVSARGLEVDFLVECDTGLGRTGVQSPGEARELALLVDQLPGLRFAGLMTYPTGPQTPVLLQAARAAIEAAGLPVDCVSGGGTETAFSTHESGVITELRVGTYVYGDRACIANGSVSLEDCALLIHATVVSRPTSDRAILDAGSKTLTTDPAEAPGVEGYGLIRERPLAQIDELFEEHARVRLSANEPPLEIGDMVSIVPNHACGTTNMQNEVVIHRNGRMVGWWPVAARGAVR
ncbi:MAG TPA: alanine racemase [Solirubrobacteraceae bacterium]|nr:alanine racemase [Solirubrobacteraceae bacterium]